MRLHCRAHPTLLFQSLVLIILVLRRPLEETVTEEQVSGFAQTRVEENREMLGGDHGQDDGSIKSSGTAEHLHALSFPVFTVAACRPRILKLFARFGREGNAGGNGKKGTRIPSPGTARAGEW